MSRKIPTIIFVIFFFFNFLVFSKDYKNVEYSILNNNEFNVFLKKWDASQSRTLFAFISSEKQWEELFHPAAVMWSKNKFKPEKKFFNERNIILIAINNVTPLSNIEIEKVYRENDNLNINYKFNIDKTNSSYFINQYLLITVFKDNCKNIKFLRGKNHIASLIVDEGKCRFPEL